MKIEIIENSDSYYGLETEVNKFLEKENITECTIDTRREKYTQAYKNPITVYMAVITYKTKPKD